MKLTILNEQDQYRLNKDLVKTTLRTMMVHEAHVPDTLTRIRVLEGVAVVGQSTQVFRKKAGKTVLDIYVKFLPKDSNTLESLMSLLSDIKTLPGVEVIKVVTVDGKEVMRKGKPIVV